jgi:IclR family transcriptional regulator, acetate operon repressor
MTAPRINEGIPRNQSLSRAVLVMQALAETPAGVPATALAETTGMSLPTLMRTLATLADHGLVERGERREWRLGYELIRLARSVDRHAALVEQARPVLDQLVRELRLTAMLGVDNGHLAVDVLAQSDAPQLMRPRPWVGEAFPLHASAFGKLALARLPEAEFDAYLASAALDRYGRNTITDRDLLRAEVERLRETDWTPTFDENEDGLSGIAIAIPDEEHDRAILVVVAGSSARFTREEWLAFEPDLRRITMPLRPQPKAEGRGAARS